jgi:hypothetical protein
MDDIRVYIVLSEFISLGLIYRVWRNERYLIFKVLISIVTIIPFVGPVLYLFVSDKTAPQAPELQDRGARGQYTQNYISSKARLDRDSKKDFKD